MAILSGDAGPNTISGTASADRIYGRAGEDDLHGQDGDDMIRGQAGDDALYGDVGDDTLYGGRGNDTLEGGAGADFLDGGAGVNTASYAHSAAAVSIDLFTGTHTGDAAGDTYADIWAYALTNFDDELFGDNSALTAMGLGGNDTIRGAHYVDYAFYGGEGDDSLSGFTNDDTLIGENGDDTLTGWARDDVVVGGAGADRLDGGGGTDRIVGNDGMDVLMGSRGSDTLVGGLGADRLTGGHNSDLFMFYETAQSTATDPDLIRDLNLEDMDQIWLKAIDADTNKDGNQAFHLSAELTGQARQLTLSYDAERDITSLLGDVDGDGLADLVVEITGDHTDFTNFNL